MLIEKRRWHRILFMGAMFFLSFHINAQYESGVTIPDSTLISDSTTISYRLSKYISADDMKKNLTILASDEMEGREVGTPGNDKAAAYISTQLKELNISLPPDAENYYQNIAFSYTRWNKVNVTVGDTTFRHLWDFLAFPTGNESIDVSMDEITFLGYGIDDNRYSDYEKLNLKGKTIIIYEGEPMKNDTTYWISDTSKESLWSNTENKLKIAKRKGVDLVLVIKNDFKQFLGENRRKVIGSTVKIGDVSLNKKDVANHIYISSTMAQYILGDNADVIIKKRDKIKHSGNPESAEIGVDMKILLDRNDNILKGQNIMAYFEGSDKKDELIIVSAHYDHIGMRGDDIFNGADDNGSGSVTLLEVASALQAGVKQGHYPSRSILCLWLTGEERGLLGSKYYIKNPVFPLEKTIANINIDMVGRVDQKYAGQPHYIYVIGSDRLSSDLHTINEDINDTYEKLILDYKYNDEKDPNRFYYRSDHYSFAEIGIPAIFFFNGTHADYHRASDTVEKINFDKMEKIGRHIFHLMWELANRKETIVKDKN